MGYVYRLYTYHPPPKYTYPPGRGLVPEIPTLRRDLVPEIPTFPPTPKGSGTRNIYPNGRDLVPRILPPEQTHTCGNITFPNFVGGQQQLTQDCIPVGCVPPACQPYVFRAVKTIQKGEMVHFFTDKLCSCKIPNNSQ